MVDEARRAQIQRIRTLQGEFPQLSSPREDHQNLRIGKVGIIGATNFSGFGANLGRAVLAAHPENSIILTGRGKRLEDLRALVRKGDIYDPSRTEVQEFDVTNPAYISESVSDLVVCPAFMNPKFLRPEVRFEDIPQDEIEKSTEVTLRGFDWAAKSFGYDGNPCVWGVTFAAHDFPGYNIGPIKHALEARIRFMPRTYPGRRQNVFSLGIFPSVAAEAMPSFARASEMYDALGITNPSLSEMVYGAVKAMANKGESAPDREIISLDGGLRTALADPVRRRRYDELRASFT